MSSWSFGYLCEAVHRRSRRIMSSLNICFLYVSIPTWRLLKGLNLRHVLGLSVVEDEYEQSEHHHLVAVRAIMQQLGRSVGIQTYSGWCIKWSNRTARNEQRAWHRLSALYHKQSGNHVSRKWLDFVQKKTPNQFINLPSFITGHWNPRSYTQPNSSFNNCQQSSKGDNNIWKIAESRNRYTGLGLWAATTVNLWICSKKARE